MANERILVVDDNKDILELCEEELKNNGYIVTTASNGEAALKLCKQHKFDLILTDHALESITGLDVLREVKLMNPDCEVIIMSGSPSQKLAREARDNHASAFISKPFKLTDLADKIKTCLNRKITRERLKETKRAVEEMKCNGIHK